MQAQSNGYRARKWYLFLLFTIFSFIYPGISLSASPSIVSTEKYDVIIVGAGVAGLAAADRLNKKHYKVLVLEARNRLGGRIWTVYPWGTALDLGASWIHGVKNNPVSKLLKKASVKTIPTSYNSSDIRLKLQDSVFYDKNGRKVTASEMQQALSYVMNFEALVEQSKDTSQSIADLFKSYVRKNKLSGPLLELIQQEIILSYVYEFAADLDKLSIQAEGVYEESQVSGKEVILPGGYMQLIALLVKNIFVELNQEVKEIHYSKDAVEVVTQDRQYHAKKIIVTVPVSVLKAKRIAFHPELPAEKLSAIAASQTGVYNKIILYFDKVFWDKNKEWSSLVPGPDSHYPILDVMNYYKFSKEPILIIFTAGREAAKMESKTDAQIMDIVMQELRIMYGKNIPSPSSYVITRWLKDPYALGSYSYLAKATPIDYYTILGAPVNNVLFFAGEATSPTDPSTVHGAYMSGIRAAKEIEQGN